MYDLGCTMWGGDDAQVEGRAGGGFRLTSIQGEFVKSILS
jgi:hypothetical protein